MKREIKFRGKRIDNGEWVYGDLLHSEKNFKKTISILDWSQPDGENIQEVLKDTVSEFTSFTHKEKEIYEGDVMAVYLGEDAGIDYQPVHFKDGCFVLGKLSPTPLHEELEYWKENIWVAGNIYENGDLIK